jgi:hypothetical protein
MGLGRSSQSKWGRFSGKCWESKRRYVGVEQGWPSSFVPACGWMDDHRQRQHLNCRPSPSTANVSCVSHYQLQDAFSLATHPNRTRHRPADACLRSSSPTFRVPYYLRLQGLSVILTGRGPSTGCLFHPEDGSSTVHLKPL